MTRRRFSGLEDRARIKIVAESERGVVWTEVSQKLEEQGFPHRSISSIRNRHLRFKLCKIMKPDSKNQCRVCGLPQKGHVCGGVEN